MSTHTGDPGIAASAAVETVIPHRVSPKFRVDDSVNDFDSVACLHSEDFGVRRVSHVVTAALLHISTQDTEDRKEITQIFPRVRVVCETFGKGDLHERIPVSRSQR
jgi:hypothetical protein